jgi:serine/threonine kinase 38
MSHPFFKDVNWVKLRERKPPYIPEIEDAWDTQNFDKYE